MDSVSILSTNLEVKWQKSQWSRDWNSGLLGGKQECFLCATQPPRMSTVDNFHAQPILTKRLWRHNLKKMSSLGDTLPRFSTSLDSKKRWLEAISYFQSKVVKTNERLKSGWDPKEEKKLFSLTKKIRFVFGASSPRLRFFSLFRIFWRNLDVGGSQSRVETSLGLDSKVWYHEFSFGF